MLILFDCNMKIIRIANRNAWRPFPVSAFTLHRKPAGLRLEDFAREHQDEFLSGDIFVIDAHYSWHGSDLMSLDGIKLLKILRMLGYRQHCILYSFLPLQFVSAHYPHTEILLSRGTTWVQLPASINRRFCRSKLNQPCEEDILPFFRGEAAELLSTKRHSLANWWGVLRLYEILHSVGIIGKDVPKELADVINRDSSYQGMLMNFARFKGDKPQTLIPDNMAVFFQDSLKRLWKRNLKVIYVDDQAEEGWSYLLQTMLYGKERPDLFFVPDLAHEAIDVDVLAQTIVNKKADLIILDLRLEPKDDTVIAKKLSGITIAKKLTSNLSRSNTCPILIFTASDKRGVGEEALAAGADGIWTKEGIDEARHLPMKEQIDFSTTRFLDLVFMVQRLTDSEYFLLYEFLKQIKQIQSSTDHYWWQNTRWYPEDPKERVPLEKAQVIAELRRVFQAHKQFLAANHPLVNSILYDLLTVRLCRMMELFHPTRPDDSDDFISLGTTVSGDWPQDSMAFNYARSLVLMRNDVVHTGETSDDQKVNVTRYKKTMETFLRYITLQNPMASPGDSMRITGALKKKQLKKGSIAYQLVSDSLTGSFNLESDISCCQSLVGEAMERAGIVAKPLRISNRYYLNNTSIVGQEEKRVNDDAWSAEFKIHRSGPTGTSLTLSNIKPRKRVNFLCTKVPETLKVGQRIYFHITWIDDGNRFINKLFDVCTRPPLIIDYTFWSATISYISVKGDRTYLSLNKIEQPFTSYFWVANTIHLEQEDLSLIQFLPSWVQEWELTDPRIDIANTQDL